MKNPTINDCKRLWEVKWGGYIVNKDERERKWKAVMKQARKDFESVEQWYKFLRA